MLQGSYLFQGPSFWGPPAVSEFGGVDGVKVDLGVENGGHASVFLVRTCSCCDYLDVPDRKLGSMGYFNYL